jgi:methionyl-tRNA formyltransferase
MIIPRAVGLDTPAEGEPAPGQVVVRPEDRSRLLVAAGGWSLVDVLEVQPAGKRRMPAAEFLRGRHLQPGDHFGPETA